jgi:hypothetical protein
MGCKFVTRKIMCKVAPGNGQPYATPPSCCCPCFCILHQTPTTLYSSEYISYKSPKTAHHLDVMDADYHQHLSNKRALRAPPQPTRMESLPTEIRWMIYELLGYPINLICWVECRHAYDARLCVHAKHPRRFLREEVVGHPGRTCHVWSHRVPYAGHSFQAYKEGVRDVLLDRCDCTILYPYSRYCASVPLLTLIIRI